MTIDAAVARSFVHAQRKATPPAVGTSKYNALLAIADSMQKLWQAEPNVEWNSLYSLVSNGTISATNTMDLDDTINYISKRETDRAIAISPITAAEKYYNIISPNQLLEYRNLDAVAQMGRTLYFPKAFLSTSILIGYTFKVPSILYVDDITVGTQTVQVDDPMWLVYSMAAEFVRNDVVKQAQYSNLLALADQCMQRMKQANGGQIDQIVLTPFAQGENWA